MSIGVWKTIKIAFVSAIFAGVLWVAWDYVQGLVWRGGVRQTEFWFTPFIFYILLQIPAAVASISICLLLGLRASVAARFVLYPIVSVIAILTAGYVSGVNFDYPISVLLLIAVPKTAIYGVVFAFLDRNALARQREKAVA